MSKTKHPLSSSPLMNRSPLVYAWNASTGDGPMSLSRLATEAGEWTDATFGPQRPPDKALAHLADEVDEVAANPHDWSEYADCLLLIIDAARCAGFGVQEVSKLTADVLTAGYRHAAVERSEAAIGSLRVFVSQLRENPYDIELYARTLALLIYAARCVELRPMMLLRWAFAKLQVNRERTWAPDQVGIWRHVK